MTGCDSLMRSSLVYLGRQITTFPDAVFWSHEKTRNNEECTKVEDMEPKIFRALLRYVYTDSFLEIEEPLANYEEQLSRTMLVQKLLPVSEHL